MADIQPTWWGDFFDGTVRVLVIMLAAGGLYVAMRQCRRNRLVAGLLVTALVLLCGVYTLSRPAPVAISLSGGSYIFPKAPDLESVEKQVFQLKIICAVAVALVLAAIIIDLLSRGRVQSVPISPRAPVRRIEDFDGPDLDRAFALAEDGLAELWDRLAGLPEFELSGHRRLRPLAFAVFLQRTARPASAVRFDIVPWDDVAHLRICSTTLDQPIVAELDEPPTDSPPSPSAAEP